MHDFGPAPSPTSMRQVRQFMGTLTHGPVQIGQC